MTADFYGQFIEAIACFAVGAYFGVKFAFTEIIGACSGKFIRGILQFIYGLSYVLSLGFVIYVISDGDFHYYHFMLQFFGALAFVPLSRKFFRRFKKPIQKFWLRLIGRVELLNPDKTANSNAQANARPDDRVSVRNGHTNAKRSKALKKSLISKDVAEHGHAKRKRRKQKIETE